MHFDVMERKGSLVDLELNFGTPQLHCCTSALEWNPVALDLVSQASVGGRVGSWSFTCTRVTYATYGFAQGCAQYTCGMMYSDLVMSVMFC